MSELSDPFQQRITIVLDTSTDLITVDMVEMTTYAAKTILEQVLDQLDDVVAANTIALSRNGVPVELPDLVDAADDDE